MIPGEAPIPPGEILRDEFLVPFKITAYRLAKDICVPINRVTGIIKGERAITAETALRLGRYFGNSAHFWLNLQVAYSLEVAEKEFGSIIDAEVTRRDHGG